MNKQKFLFLIVILFCFYRIQAADYEVVSPDGQLKMKLHIDNGTTYEIWHGTTQLITPSMIGLNLSDRTTIGAGTVKDTETKTVNNQIDVIIGKNKTLAESYNELTVRFNEKYNLIVRAYNEGLAYRFITELKGEIIINSEDAVFNFSKTPKVYFPECDTNTSEETGDGGVKYSIHQGFRNFERTYNIYNAPVAISSNKFSVTPVLFEYPNTPYKMVITEADTYDYPGMYMEYNSGSGIRSMRGMWAKYPKNVMDPNNMYSNHLVYERENYIVKTNGNRTFPWRVIIPVDDDKLLLNNELVYLLAEPSRIADPSWIKPGKSAWEWWHKAMLEGVPFPVGNKNLSIEMYKYYIDWASQNDIEYMTLDAGYSESWVAEICKYAKSKDVKIIVWTWASCVRQYNGDWIKKMKAWGVAGAKIDFFERNDQIAMQWGYEFAQRLADSKMVAIFHGCPVPAGLNRTYPNILNFEAVRGAEDNFWRSLVTPDYHTLFPFIRSIAGPEDYTPGSMRNVTADEFYPVDKDNTVPMSMGTRAHELSMYVIFDQWLGFLCDSPTEYNKFPDILDFLSSVPTVWDKTVPLDAQLGKYILMAKQTGKDWYVGGMSNWDARSIEVDFSFLPAGVSYEAVILKDAQSSGTQPKEYANQKLTVNQNTRLTIDMAKGGGFVIRLKESGSTGIDNMADPLPLSVRVDQEAAALHIDSAGKAIEDIHIYTTSGQCIWNKNTKGDVNSFSVNLSSFNRGTYIVDVHTIQGSSRLKFIY